ncbi:MBL fold metallo-hydrolase [Facilibium subflavum]|uniref:MBL fold metallo-hydrolase n=1 Tax=Facilibium subflavum TaxID=2219058 RepID=UPI001F3C90F9|nr:MBL fold metallo-hydrolase [Facilibium subflavum]
MILVRQIFDKESCNYTYLIISLASKKGLIIDPVKEQVEKYLRLISELGITLVYTLETHTHADHISGSGLLAQKLGCKIVMGQESSAKYIDVFLKDGETITIDEDLSLKAIYTPGHTSDSYSYLIKNMIFTGDTLFIRGTGRCDFQGGSAKQQYHSIIHKLFTLPDNTIVYPGHDYNGMTCSSIYEEKKHNPRLKNIDEESYVHLMNNLGLAYPKRMDEAVPVNLNCGYE